METKTHIVIIEDDFFYAELLKARIISKHENAIVDCYISGEVFMHEIKSKPDLIILDYNLDGDSTDRMNGLELMNILYKNQVYCPIIILSGSNLIEAAIEVFKVGAFDYIIKDENAFKNLDAQIETLVKQKSLTNEYKFSEEVKKSDKKRMILALSGIVFLIVLTIVISIQK